VPSPVSLHPFQANASTEAAIQRAIWNHLQWRSHPGVFAFHPANGGFRKPVEAAILKGLGVVAGIPDLVIIHRGQVYALELKTETGKLTDAQRITHEKLRRAGAEVATVYGSDEALEQLEGEWRLLRGRTS
jgi:hypothetical protein